MSEPIRVLHVDDDPQLLDLSRALLEREGFDVVSAQSAEAGLAVLDSEPVDCVVSDYGMPDTDGLAFLEQVRTDHPDLPFILFTGKGSEEIASEAISAGVTDYLQKGTGTDQYTVLANRIERAVEERRTAAALAESERALATLVSNLPGIAYRRATRDGWPLEFVGGEVEELTGYPARAFETGELVWEEDLVAPEDREAVVRAVRQATAEGIRYRLTYRIHTADGDERWVWEQGRGVYESDAGDGGELVSVQGFITDITERRERERALERSQRQFDAMFEDPDLLVGVLDPDGTVRRVNRTGLELVEADPADVEGEPFPETPWWDHSAALQAELREAIERAADGEYVQFEATHYTPDDEPVVVDVSLRPVRGDDGAVTGIVAVGQDVTVRTERDAKIRELHRAARELMAGESTGAIADAAVEAARDVLEMPYAAVFLWDEAAGELRPAANTAAAAETIGDPPTFARGEGIVGDAFASGDPELVEDARADPRALASGSGAVRGCIVVPLGDHGVFVVSSPEPGAFDGTDADVARVLAANLEAALGRAVQREALREERDHLAALFENIPDPTIDVEFESGEPIVRRVNPAFEAVFGFDAETVAGRSVDEFIVPEDRAEVATEYNEQIQRGESFHGEVRRRTRDGVHDFILHVVPHTVGERTTRGYAIYTDITEQKERERELAEKRANLEQLNHINNTIRRVNQELVRAEDRGELLGAVCRRMADTDSYRAAWFGEHDADTGQVVPREWAGVPGEFFADVTITTDRSATGGGPAGEAVRTRSVTAVEDVTSAPSVDPWRDLLAATDIQSMTAVPIVYGDRVYGVLGVYADRPGAFDDRERAVLAELGETIGNALSAVEAREQLERQNERLAEFASVVSHDLRNPLNVAQGRLELARETGEADHLAAVERAHERMDDLITGLLQLARQGEAVGDVGPADLGAAVETAWAAVDTGDAELVVGDLPRVVADANRLRQLLENLFRNAVEHGSTSPPPGDEDAPGHGSTTGAENADSGARVTVGRIEPDGGSPEAGGSTGGFYVADDGPGVPEAARDRLFEFGYTTREGGTGFGLAIVEQIADAHGWSVAVEESADGGARFEVTGVRVVPGLEADD